MTMPEIIFEDSNLLVVNKPTKLLCVPGLSHPENLLDNIRAHYPNVRMVHRLDMATSGIVIFALNHPTQKHLGQQFEQRKIDKQYVARLNGRLNNKKGVIDMPLICDWPNRPRQKVDWEKGKKAITHYSVIADASSTENSSLVHLHPITGRSHQLRVHCLEIGHPIIGDALYAPSLTADRLMLHAERISFEHPSTGDIIHLHSPASF